MSETSHSWNEPPATDRQGGVPVANGDFRMSLSDALDCRYSEAALR